MAKFFNDSRLDNIINELNTKYSGKYVFYSKFTSDYDQYYEIVINVYDTDDNYISWVGFKIDRYGFDWLIMSEQQNQDILDYIIAEYEKTVNEILNDYYEYKED